MLGSVNRYEILVLDSDLLGGMLLVEALSRQESFHVWPLATTAEQGLQRLRLHRADLVLANSGVPEVDWADWSREVLSLPSPPRVMLMGSRISDELLRRCSPHGFIGLFDRSTESLGQLMGAVESSIHSTPYWSLSLAERRNDSRVNRGGWAGLKDRDRQLLVILSRGGTNQTAADELQISLRSVEKSLAAMRARLGLKTTAELMAHAIQDGVIALRSRATHTPDRGSQGEENESSVG